MANKQTNPPTAGPILGNENAAPENLASPKEQELREENQRLIESLKKSQERRDQLKDELSIAKERIEVLEKALDNERSISNSASIDDDLESPTPTMKQIYLAIVQATATSLTIGDKLTSQTVEKSAEHAIGLAQVFYAATRRKFLPKL